MTTRQRKRRSPGEGSVWPYKLKSGAERWSIGYVQTMPGGRRKSVTRRGYLTKAAAQKAVRDALTAASKGELVDPSKQLLGKYLETWLAGLGTGGDDDQGSATIASYRKNVRLHITPYLGHVPLRGLTPQDIAGLYRDLLRSGRRDWKGGGLSARSVRYIHTILSQALADAVSAKLISTNPAGDKKHAKPPTAKQARSPEMHPWDARQLAAFLAWSAEHSDLHAAWYVLAMTGMRRGELLALRWRDVDLGRGTVSIAHSVGVVRNKGEGEVLEEGEPKTEKSRRVIDIDPATVALLTAHRRARGSVHLNHLRPEALVFGNYEGKFLHPERFSRTFRATLDRCARGLGDDAPPRIRLHDLRHTHATLLLADREPIKTVSERLGHSSVNITLNTYGHVMPGDQKRAADRFAALIREAGA